MKGFPNQVSDLKTLASALKVLVDLIQVGENPKDDGVYGEALIRQNVLGTGHHPVPVETYLAEQKRKKTSDQSFRTRARQLRELFRALSLIDDRGSNIQIHHHGHRIAAIAGEELTPTNLRLWRNVIVNMSHYGGDSDLSHPYQVLLRLVAKRPGITRSMCALALEAKNDSEHELERIIKLSDLNDEVKIITNIGVEKSNWNNAKKILPKFAEQLLDVTKIGHKFYLSDAPGILSTLNTETEVDSTDKGARTPRSSSIVTADTIAKSGTTDNWDETNDTQQPEIDPELIIIQKAKLKKRLKRHNLIVKELAILLQQEDVELYENPFDCLACFSDEGLLIEVKTLDGTDGDEIARVREALAQLLYYESFVTKPLIKKRAIRKIACFEHQLSGAHIDWLQANDIFVIWKTNIGFDGTNQARDELSGHFNF